MPSSYPAAALSGGLLSSNRPTGVLSHGLLSPAVLPAASTNFADAVGNAAAAAVESLSLSGVTVVRRKAPTLPQGVDPPAVIVVVGEEGDSDYFTATKDIITYPVGVVYVTAGGTKLADDPGVRDARQAIRRAMEGRYTFDSVAGFNRVQASGRLPFHPSALPKDLNYSVQGFAVEVIEDRDGV